ncbi:LOG family protein [Lignipirellula cremea]|uniref:AMP nucleosidase n=1 Tax=Lignipirellula cremea TaxID=2528010 RepID=A0A518DQP1_9BACT|nr:TIGR00730 family Rossman fold protein [Lignipirellula cremea]QDU94151.1 LOG family protein ORF6 in fasciation locus [Lignipirellula cremea]
MSDSPEKPFGEPSDEAAGADHARQVGRTDDIVAQMQETIEKLVADDASRGDMKILSRTLRELRYAFKVFAQYRERRKVTVFGSARTPPEAPAYQQAADFGEAMAAHDWFVLTGAAAGIMEAGHVGAGRENSMGLNIMLPFEQSSNTVIEGDHKLVHMKYFFTRKLMFVKECDALVCLPGGFGTLDEALEVLTLLQTGKRNVAPVVLLDAPGGGYWKALDSFIQEHMLQGGMISPEDLSLYKVTESCEEAVNECLHFYSVYHSMRYVRDRLVFRLNQPLSAELLAAVNEHFADILTEGCFDQRGPLKHESDEPDLAHLTRLVFTFNRRDLGRLRQLVDCLNNGRITP